MASEIGRRTRRARTSAATSEPEPVVTCSGSQYKHVQRDARTPAYTPPQPRNVGAPPPKPSASKTNESAYRTQPPVYDAQAAQDVHEHQELLSIAPEVRAELRLAVSSRRIATEAASYTLADMKLVDVPVLDRKAAHTMVSQYEVLPDGGIRVPDVYEQYFKEHSDEDEVPMMVVSKESSAINCIIDPGSSIISMSEGVCHAFSMQSANGEIDHTLGLFRSKLRPFDILGETLAQNFRDESQLIMITVHDPNSSASISIPTKPRSRPRFPNQRPAVHFGPLLDHDDLQDGQISMAALIIPALDSSPAPRVSTYALLDSASLSAPSTLQSLSIYLPATLSFSRPTYLLTLAPRIRLCTTTRLTRRATRLHQVSTVELAPLCFSSLPRLTRLSVVGSMPLTLVPLPIYADSKKKYKPVSRKVHPVRADLPADELRIVRNIVGDPLEARTSERAITPSRVHGLLLLQPTHLRPSNFL